MIIDRGKIQNPEEGEPFPFVTQDNENKGKGISFNQIKSSPESKYSKRILRKDRPQVECYNFHKYGHYAWDWPIKRDAPWSNRDYKNNRYNDRRRNDGRRKGDDIRKKYDRRRRNTSDD